MLELIFLVIAAFFIFSRLFKMFGKYDNEDFDIETSDFLKKMQSRQKDGAKYTFDINIVSATEAALPQKVRDVFDNIRKVEKDFNADHFLNGAKTAFEMIIKAYAKGDTQTLKHLLSENVLKNFIANINDRVAKDYTLEILIVGINNIEILDASIDNSIISISIKINSDQVLYIKDKSGNIISGNEKKVVEHKDVMIFTRALLSKSAWLLQSTESV